MEESLSWSFHSRPLLRASVPGALSDNAPNFDRHVFALSGVSGGAFGVAVYGSMPQDARTMPCGGKQSCAQKILSYDFLAPALAALLTRDVLGGLALARI